jgi:hypothetical protein
MIETLLCFRRKCTSTQLSGWKSRLATFSREKAGFRLPRARALALAGGSQVFDLGPAFDDRHPEQCDKPTLGVVHDYMVSLDLGATGYYGLGADSRVLEPHNVSFVAQLHLPDTSSASIFFRATSALAGFILSARPDSVSVAACVSK